jgi:hypothetical protein
MHAKIAHQGKVIANLTCLCMTQKWPLVRFGCFRAKPLNGAENESTTL